MCEPSRTSSFHMLKDVPCFEIFRGEFVTFSFQVCFQKLVGPSATSINWTSISIMWKTGWGGRGLNQDRIEGEDIVGGGVSATSTGNKQEHAPAVQIGGGLGTWSRPRTQCIDPGGGGKTTCFTDLSWQEKPYFGSECLSEKFLTHSHPVFPDPRPQHPGSSPLGPLIHPPHSDPPNLSRVVPTHLLPTFTKSKIYLWPNVWSPPPPAQRPFEPAKKLFARQVQNDRGGAGCDCTKSL